MDHSILVNSIEVAWMGNTLRVSFFVVLSGCMRMVVVVSGRTWQYLIVI
jgi:hypothetical protein